MYGNLPLELSISGTAYRMADIVEVSDLATHFEWVSHDLRGPVLIGPSPEPGKFLVAEYAAVSS